MSTTKTWRRWLLGVLCCAAVLGLPQVGRAADGSSMARSRVKVMIMVQGPGQERNQFVEDTIAQAFLRQGYEVIDAATVTQSLRRNAYLLKQAQIEAAKRLGSGLGADIVVGGEARGHVVDKSYTMLEGKKVTISQGHVTVKAVLSRGGKVIATENATQRKPFDTTAQIALQMAAEAAAGKLIQGIEQFLNRDTTDYHLLVQNVDASQLLAFQESLRNRVKGVRQVNEHRSQPNVSELKVSVEKDQDLPFKQNLFSQLTSLGMGTFEVVAREGETIHLHKTGASMPAPRESERSPAPKPSGSPAQGPVGASSSVGVTKYKPGYGKSWAVLIGINEYQQWPKLRYAVNDARSVENVVRRLGFTEVITLLDGDAT